MGERIFGGESEPQFYYLAGIQLLTNPPPATSPHTFTHAFATETKALARNPASNAGRLARHKHAPLFLTVSFGCEANP